MDLFHFDIETRGQYRDWDHFRTMDERGAKIFEGKWRRNGWSEKFAVEDSYLTQAGVTTTYGSICCISCGYINDGGDKMIKSFWGEDEREIVNDFNELLKKIQTKSFKLSGFRIAHFDIPWVLHKLHKHGIEPAEIIKPYDKKPWDMRIVDMADDWRQKMSYQFSFDEMCYELGVESPKQHMDGSMVHEAYWNGEVDRIKDYCEQDVRASIEAGILLYGK